MCGRAGACSQREGCFFCGGCSAPRGDCAMAAAAACSCSAPHLLPSARSYWQTKQIAGCTSQPPCFACCVAKGGTEMASLGKIRRVQACATLTAAAAGRLGVPARVGQLHIRQADPPRRRKGRRRRRISACGSLVCTLPRSSLIADAEGIELPRTLFCLLLMACMPPQHSTSRGETAGKHRAAGCCDAAASVLSLQAQRACSLPQLSMAAPDLHQS